VREIALGLVAAALALGYWLEAEDIQESLLSDAIGTGGVPKVLAAILGGAGLLMALRGALARGGRIAGERAAEPAHGRALGLLGLLVGYALLVPLLGYPVTLGAFAVAVAAYAGARPGPAMLGFGLGVAVLFWVGFVKLLGVAFPVGALFGGGA
jgi:putative tricarboxylic transport membrane protein